MTPKRTSRLCGLFCLILIVAICDQLAGAGQSIPTEGLFVAPEQWERESLTFSDDGQRYAFTVKASGGEYVINNGRNEETFPDVGSVVFSPQTGRLFYWAGDGKRLTLVADGKSIPTEYVYERRIQFSKDGKRWVVIGGTQYTPDGNSVRVGPVIIIADGKELGRYRDASSPMFSPDGKHLAYLAQDGNSIGLYIDGKRERSYPTPEGKSSPNVTAFMVGPNMHVLFSCQYLSDGRLLILAQDTNGWVVRRDNEVLGTYLQNVWGGGALRVMTFSEFKTSASIVAWSVTVADDAPTAIWWERIPGEQERWRVAKDGAPVDSIVCAEWWDSQPPVLSANGLHCGYGAFTKATNSTGAEVHAIVDGKEYGPYGNVWGITFTRDGTHFAYAASEPNVAKSWRFFLGGQPISSKYNVVWAPVLSSDGAHIAWKAERESKVVIGLDGNDVASEKEVVWGPRFDETRRLSWIIRDDKQVSRRSMLLESPR